MEATDLQANALPSRKRRMRAAFAQVPALGWLAGILCTVLIETLWGDPLSYQLYLPKLPVLFGCLIMFKQPVLIPSALAYVALIYVIPIAAVALASQKLTNTLAARLSPPALMVLQPDSSGAALPGPALLGRFERLP